MEDRLFMEGEENQISSLAGAGQMTSFECPKMTNHRSFLMLLRCFKCDRISASRAKRVIPCSSLCRLRDGDT